MIFFAAKAHKQYAYCAKALTQITRERTGKLEYMVEAKVDNGKEFDNLIENLDSTMNCVGTGNKPRPVLAKPKQYLTGKDKVNDDLTKEAKELQAELDRDHNTLLQLRIRGWHDEG